MSQIDGDLLHTLHGEVWALRTRIKATWPTPNVLASLRFAFTEALEAMDAQLRIEGGYARNHAKEPDVLGELCDCTMMLMTAIGPEYTYKFKPFYGVIGDLDDICFQVSDTLREYRHAEPGWRRRAHVALCSISIYTGMDLAVELRKRMAKIEANHGPKENDNATL